MKAKEYFEGIRAEVVKTDKARDMLERMKAKEGAKAQSYTEGRGGGEVSDGSLSILQRIDFEDRLQQRINNAQGVIDEACELLYGQDGAAGLPSSKAPDTPTQSAWAIFRRRNGRR